MVLVKALDRGRRVPLPCFLHFTTVIGLRFPITMCVLTGIECASVIALIVYTDRVSLFVASCTPPMCGVLFVMVLLSGVRVWSSKILDELVDFLGASATKACFAQANSEAKFSVLVSTLMALIPVGCYIMELQSELESLGEVHAAVIHSCIAVAFVVGALCGAVGWGLVVLVRLVSGLLIACVHKHFDHVEAVLAGTEVTKAEAIAKLDGHCKNIRIVFARANACVTTQIFTAITFAYLVSLILMLQVVVNVRSGDAPLFLLLTCSAVTVLIAGIATALLQSLTSVADTYEDLAADLNHNIELRFKFTDTFGGPAGVKFLNAVEVDHMNELSFNVHHKPLDRTVLEGTLLRLAMGAVITIAVGVLTKPVDGEDQTPE